MSDTISSPVASGTRRGFCAVAVAFAATMAGTTLPTPLYPVYQHLFGFSGFTSTVVYAVYALAVIAALVLCGDLSDRIGRRPVLTAALLAGALSAVCFLLADGLGLLLAGRVLSGLSAGLMTGTAGAALTDLAAPRFRPRAALVAAAANIGGLGLGPVLSGVLSEWLPAPRHLVFALHLALLVVAGAALLLRLREPVAVREPFRLNPRLGVPPSVRGTFARIGLAVFAGFAVTGLFAAVVPEMLQELGVTGRATAGGVVCAVFAGSLAGQQTRRALDDRAALAGGGAALVLGAVLLIAALHLGSVAMLVAAAIVSGIGHGMVFAAGMTLITAAAPDGERAAVGSALFLVAYLGISVPVVGLGALGDAAGLVTGGTVFAVVVAVLAAAGSTAARTRRA